MRKSINFTLTHTAQHGIKSSRDKKRLERTELFCGDSEQAEHASLVDWWGGNDVFNWVDDSRKFEVDKFTFSHTIKKRTAMVTAQRTAERVSEKN